MFHPFSIEVQNYCKILKPQRILPFLAECITAKGLASQRTLYATLLTNNLKQLMQKEQITYENQITDAKVRGFWADSKKFA